MILRHQLKKISSEQLVFVHKYEIAAKVIKLMRNLCTKASNLVIEHQRFNILTNLNLKSKSIFPEVVPSGANANAESKII